MMIQNIQKTDKAYFIAHRLYSRDNEYQTHHQLVANREIKPSSLRRKLNYYKLTNYSIHVNGTKSLMNNKQFTLTIDSYTYLAVA